MPEGTVREEGEDTQNICLECGQLLGIECMCGPSDLDLDFEATFPFHPLESPQW